ncbi:MAG: NUDIX hydrolase [Moraxellaceae bacterium]|nr:NUDIX hydrolase [Moraxellaceae bacterium]
MRQQIRNEIAGITPLDELESSQIADTLRWIDSGTELCRTAKPATPPRHLVSYFACVDLREGGGHVLLVDHINAQLWLPTGGHVEPGEHPRTTVLREAHEELGLTVDQTADFLLPTPLFLTATETVGLTAGHVDVSLWYVLMTDRHVRLDYDAGEFHGIRWFALDAVPLTRSDPQIGRFLRKLALTTRAAGPVTAP